MSGLDWERAFFVKYGVEHAAVSGGFFGNVRNMLAKVEFSSSCYPQVVRLFGPVDRTVVDF